jgi:hypothetical protein
MMFGGVLADDERRSDLAVGPAFPDERQYLTIAGSASRTPETPLVGAPACIAPPGTACSCGWLSALAR